MLNLTDYTTYDEVRAILGVSDEELDDEVLGLPLIALGLEGELDDVTPILIPKYDELRVKKDTGTALEPMEQRLLNVTQVFAAYAVAKNMMASETRFALKKITDGKASMERFSGDNTALLEGVMNGYYQARARLIAILVSMGLMEAPTVRRRAYFGVAGLSRDPVTGV